MAKETLECMKNNHEFNRLQILELFGGIGSPRISLIVWAGILGDLSPR